VGDHLPGEKNALWLRGRSLYANGLHAQLIEELQEWGRLVEPPPLWQSYGLKDGPEVAQAKSLAKGMRQVLLALAELGRGDRDEGYRHLLEACQAYEQAWRQERLTAPPPPSALAVDAEEVLRLYLAHLETCWGPEVIGLPMVGSALAEFFPSLLPPQPRHTVHLPVLLVHGTGKVKDLTLEWFASGTAGRCLFPDPVALGTTTLDDGFLQALDAAWRYARAEFPEGSRVRWQIKPLEGERWLRGVSAGGALAAGLWGLAHGLTFDRAGVTATVQADGTLGPVLGVLPKVVAATAAKVSTFVLSRHDRHRHDYLSRLIEGVEVREANTVAEALPHLTGVMEGLLGPAGYLVELQRRLGDFRWPCPQPHLNFFKQLHITVRVSTQRREAQRDEERRRLPGPQSAYQDPAEASRFQDRERGEPPMPWWDEKAPERSARGRQCRAVLLGDPGIGKTTLLHYEGWLTAREQIEALQAGKTGIADVVLPVFLRLADLARVAPERDMVEAVADLATDPRRGGVPVAPPVKQLLRQKLQAGQVVLLLDGLDEVPGQLYEELVRWLQGWLTSYPPQKCLLTSRLVGYRGPPLDLRGAGKAELELVAFSPTEIQQFMTAYFGETTLPDAEQRLADELWRQLQHNPGMLGLAQTPLLLTLICTDCYEEGTRWRLPATRCELYSRCLDGFVGRWPHLRRDIPAPDLGDDDAYHLRRELLAEVAWQLSGSDPEHTLFTPAEVRAAMRRCPSQLEELGWTVLEARQQLGEAHGILIKSGAGKDGQYLFLHRTFQEYLLAWALARREEWLSIALQHVHDPAWEEPLVLLGGVLDQQDREAGRKAGERSLLYISALVKENANDLLCRPVLIAARVAGEARALPAELRRQLAESLVNRRLGNGILPDAKRLFLSLQAIRSFALEPLLATLQDRGRDAGERMNAAEILGELGVGRREVVMTLHEALFEKETGVGGAAAQALGKLAETDADALAALRIAQTSSWALAELVGQEGSSADMGPSLQEWAELCNEAASARSSEERIVAALRMALKCRSERYRQPALWLLQRTSVFCHWEDDPGFAEFLAEGLAVRDEHVCELVGKGVELLAREDDEVVVAIREVMAPTDPHPIVSESAEAALIRIGKAPGHFVQALAGTQKPGLLQHQLSLQEFANLCARVTAQRAAQPEVMAALRAQLTGGWKYFRMLAALTLAELGQDDAEVVEALRLTLRDWGNPEQKWTALRLLAHLGQGHPEVVADLLHALNHEEPVLQEAAAEALGQLRCGSQEVVSALQGIVREEESWEVVGAAIVALHRLGQIDRDVLKPLLVLLKHEEISVRIKTAEVLGELGEATPAILAGLQDTLRDESWQVRRAVVQALTQLGHDHPEAGTVLQEALRDDDLTVWWEVLKALEQLSPTIGAAIPPGGANDFLRKEHAELQQAIQAILSHYCVQHKERPVGL
jgi:HEAT repeat protein